MAASKKKATARKPAAKKPAAKAATKQPAKPVKKPPAKSVKKPPAKPVKKPPAKSVKKPPSKSVKKPATTAKATPRKESAAKATPTKQPAAKTAAKSVAKDRATPKQSGATAVGAKPSETPSKASGGPEQQQAGSERSHGGEAGRPTLDAVMAEIDAAEEAPLAGRLAALDALEPRCWQLQGEDRAEALASLASAQQGCIDFAFTDADARGALLASVREAPYRSERVEMLAKLSDEEAYRLVREQAVAQLVTAYYHTQPAWLFALGGFAKQGPFADDARALLLGAFQQLVVHAQAHDELVNSVGFGALAYAAAGVAHPDTGRVLERAFAIAAGKTDVKAHYELKLVAGPLALALAAIDHVDAKEAIREVVTEAEDIYPGDDHVMQMRYALWMLEQDPRAACAYVTNIENKKNLGLAAAVIADLDYKPARDSLAQRARMLEHPVAQEVFAEVLQRLDRQQGPPPPAGRVIWMFGRKSSTEQALGSESDNVFVQRAVARTKDVELGIVYEADNAAPDD